MWKKTSGPRRGLCITPGLRRGLCGPPGPRRRLCSPTGPRIKCRLQIHRIASWNGPLVRQLRQNKGLKTWRWHRAQLCACTLMNHVGAHTALRRQRTPGNLWDQATGRLNLVPTFQCLNGSKASAAASHRGVVHSYQQCCCMGISQMLMVNVKG